LGLDGSNPEDRGHGQRVNLIQLRPSHLPEYLAQGGFLGVDSEDLTAAAELIKLGPEVWLI
jgi:hypothetical protein